MKYAGIILLLLVTLTSFAQKKPAPKDSVVKTRILFIFDASQSMWGLMDGETKIAIAQRLLSTAIDSLKNIENVEVALRVYGNRKAISKEAQDCEDTHLEVPFEKNNIEKIKHVLKATQPKGTTLIARSLEASETDFPPCENCRNIIILITDGIEACDGDPCAVSRALQQNGVILKPFVIGLGMDQDYSEYFRCMGEYYDASNKNSFKQILSIVIAEALSTTTCQVNLLNVNQKPIETNVNMTFYDQRTGEVKYNLVHALNYKGNPDTISIDPLTTYKIVVHTKPEVSIENIRFKPGEHTTISIDAPQGSLFVKAYGNTNNIFNYQYIIKKLDDNQLLNVQSFERTDKYIVGEYQVELLTIPRIIDTIQIAQSETKKIEIPQPGSVGFQSLTNNGFGSIYQLKNGKLELIYELNADNINQIINMLPGTYTVVYRSKTAKRSIYTIEKKFKVESGKTVKVELF